MTQPQCQSRKLEARALSWYKSSKVNNFDGSLSVDLLVTEALDNTRLTNL